MDHYYMAGEEQVGPYDKAQIKQLARDGVITNDTLIWREDMEDWMTFGDLKATSKQRSQSGVKVRAPQRQEPVRQRSSRAAGQPYTQQSTGPNMAKVGIGILMILGAIVWFFGGLAVGYIFFYPPILLIIGIFTMFKGFSGRQ